jgi:hypothetical protein
MAPAADGNSTQHTYSTELFSHEDEEEGDGRSLTSHRGEEVDSPIVDLPGGRPVLDDLETAHDDDLVW